MSAVTAILPVFGALIVMVLLASVVLGGWNFSTQALTPDFSRLNPLSGLKRLFGLHGVSELAKALLKCLVVGAVCAESSVGFSAMCWRLGAWRRARRCRTVPVC